MIKTDDIIKIVERISDIRRYHQWKRLSRKRASSKSILSSEQIGEISKLFSAYKKVSADAHAFYTEKTGKFCAEYIPD